MTSELANGSVPDGGYTAVIYFHGIGEQRRYEETSRLVDSIDRYLAGCFSRGKPKGMLMGIKPQLRPGIADPTDVFTHIVVAYTPDRRGARETVTFRRSSARASLPHHLVPSRRQPAAARPWHRRSPQRNGHSYRSLR